MIESVRRFFAFINAKGISPWVIVLLGAVSSVAWWQATVTAQESELKDLKAGVRDVELDSIGRDDNLRLDVIQRLDRITTTLDRMDTKLEHMDDRIDSLHDAQKRVK